MGVEVPRVLLIDDETHLARALIRLLEEAGAREVEWAATAHAALACARAAAVDIVVSDFDLGPGSPNGVTVMGELRARYPRAVMVCVSGSPRPVPSWCEFIDKTDTASLAELVRGWRDVTSP